jgi:hypothetical protein
MRRQGKTQVVEIVTQLLVGTGAAVFVYGVWTAWHPGGFMVAGLVIAVPSIFVAYGNYRGEN